MFGIFASQNQCNGTYQKNNPIKNKRSSHNQVKQKKGDKQIIQINGVQSYKLIIQTNQTKQSNETIKQTVKKA